MTEVKNWDLILMNCLSQEANLFINKKLLAKYGLDLAAFISFLISQYTYFYKEGTLTKDKRFYTTNENIFLFTNMPRTRISSVKDEAIKLGIIDVKQMGIPAKSFYKINFELLVTVLSDENSVKEIAYKRNFKDDVVLENDSLSKLTYNELRLLCKKNNIRYSGKDKKIDLINALLNILCENNEFSNYKENSVNEQATENKDAIQWVEKSPTEQSIENRDVIQWVEKSPTSGQKSYPLVGGKVAPNHNINQYNINNHDNHDNHDSEHDYFEKMFKEEFNVNYTKSNQLAIKNLRKKMSKQQVVDYLKETYNNLQDNKDKINNIAALFSSKIKKQERQINISTKKNNIVTSDVEIHKQNKHNLEDTVKINNSENIEIVNFLEKIKKIDDVKQFVAEYEKIDSYTQLEIEEKAINYHLNNTSDIYTQEELFNLKYENENEYLRILQQDILSVMKSEVTSYSAAI